MSIFIHIIYAFVQTIKGGAFMKLCITAGKTVISIHSHELRYSPFMYLCPGFKVIPLKKRLPHGTKESTTPLNLSFN